jgi:hypothetical protein
MDKQKQIEEMLKLDIEQSVSGYSAFINDMRISKAKPLSVSKTIISLDCPKKYIYEAIGIPEGAVVLTKAEYEEYERYKDLLTQYMNGEIVNEDIFIQQVEDIKQARKETAEKFALKVADYFVEHCGGRLSISLTLQEWYKMIDEICKEITEV